MPGMMDTILNLGLNDVAVDGLAAATGNPRFACDSYRRLIQMYGEVVDGVDGHRFEQRAPSLKARRGVAAGRRPHRRRPPRADRDVSSRSTRSETGAPFPQDAARAAARARSRAVFDSWESPRAQVYRRTYEIPDDLGTAVNVVQMVFGNKGDDSGTGVALHARPVDRRAGALRRVPRRTPRARTSSPGIRTPEPIDEHARAGCPRRTHELARRRSTRLEEHYRDMQDIEFTVEDGTLYLLQTRTAKRTAAAALQDRRRDGRARA